MSSAGSKAGQGAISGAAAGSAFGPWGTAIGAVAGGIGGYLQGDDPTAPAYVAPPPPVTPGGMSSQYGGSQVDPVTGRVIYTDNTVNGYDQASNYQRQLMMQSMLGGNGAQVGMDSQIAQAKAYLAQLQAQGSKSTPQNIPAEYRDMQKFIGPDGKLPDISDTNAIFDGRINTPQAKALVEQFQKDTGGNYGGKGAIGFGKWVRDFNQRNLQPMMQAFQKMQDVQGGNADTNAQAIQAAQQRLDNLLRVQGSGAQTEADFAKNPLMNFLNQRNTTPGAPADYDALREKYNDPNAAVMQDQFKKYLGQADQVTDSTAFKIAGGTDPGMPDVQAANARLLGATGGAGGERMAPLDPFHSNAGAVVNNLNRTAERNYASQAGLQSQLNARRGVMGGSGDMNRLAMEQALEDNRAANAATGYGLERGDRTAYDQLNFNINAHNSDVAKTGAQFNLNALNQTFGNELAAKDFYNKMQQQAWANNQGEQQRNFGNAMTSLNQTTGLNQNAINNARYEQGYEDTANRQNFGDRMGLLGFLQGADQQSYNQGMGNSQMALNQSGQAFGVSGQIANNTNNWNASNAAGQNAQNAASQGQAINNNAQWMNTINQAAGALGQVDWSQWGSQPTTQAVNFTPAAQQTAVPTQQRPTGGGLFDTALSSPQTAAAPSYGVYNPSQPAAAAPPAAAPWSYTGGVWSPPTAPKYGAR